MFCVECECVRWACVLLGYFDKMTEHFVNVAFMNKLSDFSYVWHCAVMNILRYRIDIGSRQISYYFSFVLLRMLTIHDIMKFEMHAISFSAIDPKYRLSFAYLCSYDVRCALFVCVCVLCMQPELNVYNEHPEISLECDMCPYFICSRPFIIMISEPMRAYRCFYSLQTWHDCGGECMSCITLKSEEYWWSMFDVNMIKWWKLCV